MALDSKFPTGMSKNQLREHLAKNCAMSKKQVDDIFDTLASLATSELNDRGVFTIPGIVNGLSPDTVAQLLAILPPWAATAYGYLKIIVAVSAGVARVVAQKVPESSGPPVAEPVPADPVVIEGAKSP